MSGFQISETHRERGHIFWLILDGKCRIRIGSDFEGHVSLSLAPQNTLPESWDKWIYLEIVIYLLTKRQRNLDYLDGPLDQNYVLKTLADELQVYAERIIKIFSGTQITEYEIEFTRLRKEMNVVSAADKKSKG